jgi:hypothetical protein|tara:strand:+ start:324 stop:560 length:237 start_codon:yes stop_codon:yes gene_type:complete
MSNYDVDESERQERTERFEHAINCMDIAPVAMMSFERIAFEHKISLVELLQTMLLHALDQELTKDRQEVFSFTDGLYG